MTGYLSGLRAGTARSQNGNPVNGGLNAARSGIQFEAEGTEELRVRHRQPYPPPRACCTQVAPTNCTRCTHELPPRVPARTSGREHYRPLSSGAPIALPALELRSALGARSTRARPSPPASPRRCRLWRTCGPSSPRHRSPRHRCSPAPDTAALQPQTPQVAAHPARTPTDSARGRVHAVDSDARVKPALLVRVLVVGVARLRVRDVHLRHPVRGLPFRVAGVQLPPAPGDSEPAPRKRLCEGVAVAACQQIARELVATRCRQVYTMQRCVAAANTAIKYSGIPALQGTLASALRCILALEQPTYAHLPRREPLRASLIRGRALRVSTPSQPLTGSPPTGPASASRRRLAARPRRGRHRRQ